jgi:hypothetical protein
MKIMDEIMSVRFRIFWCLGCGSLSEARLRPDAVD